MHINAHLDVDLVAVEATDTITVMLDLTAPQAPLTEASRPQHTAVVVLDRSGSMSGGRLEAAKRAILEVVARLDDRDNFGLVAFDSDAEVVVPAGTVADLGRAEIARRVQRVRTRGTTDLGGGYLRGLQEARRVCGQAGATIVILSDGHANVGITDPARLREVAGNAGAQAITTSTIGIGTGYDEHLLAEIATGGNGNHAFAMEPDAAAAALAEEIDGLLGKVVQAASLLIAPTDDVAGVGVLNDLPSNRVDGGILVELGDFHSGEERKLLLEFAVPAMAGLGLARIADLTLTYVELPAIEQHTVTLPVTVNVVPADVAAGRVASPDVQREKLLLRAQQAKRASEEALRDGDVKAARASLDSARTAMRAAPPSVADAQVQEEVAWLDATAEGLSEWDGAYSRKRLRSDRMRKGRGFKNRPQGGEKLADSDQGDATGTTGS